VVKRIVVGAHYGLRDWLVQRITAAVMAVYSVLFAALLVTCAPGGYGDWRALFASQWMRLATFVFFLGLLWHAWIGMRDILMDYVKPTAARLSLQVLTLIALAGYAGWAIQILWSA
jgi:succinate dehydrogenase / fumarate reductase membrane anchor subunit